jgi:hypothetical protein
MAWTLVTRLSSPGPLERRYRGLPGSCRASLRSCRSPRPRWAKCPSPITGPKMLPSTAVKVSAPTTLTNFGATYLRPVRSLSTLRSHGCPCTPQDSLAARWLCFGRMGFFTHQARVPSFRGFTSFPGRRLYPAHYSTLSTSQCVLAVSTSVDWRLHHISSSIS